jgi:AcrR family transcriptional regulator
MTDPVLGLRERKKAKLRQMILDKAIDLLREQGYEGLRIADLVEALEISQPTFFRYFPSKDDLIRSAVDQASAGGRAWIEQRNLGPELAARPLRENLLGLCEDLALLAGRERKILSALIRAGLAAPAGHVWRQGDLQIEGKEDEGLWIERLLLAARERGEIRTDLDIPEIGELIVGALNQILLRWVLDDPPRYDLQERLQRAVDGLLGGIARRPS